MRSEIAEGPFDAGKRTRTMEGEIAEGPFDAGSSLGRCRGIFRKLSREEKPAEQKDYPDETVAEGNKEGF